MKETLSPAEPVGGQILIYRDGSLDLQVRLDGQTVWLAQAGMAELYQTTPQNITLHIKAIYGRANSRSGQLIRIPYRFDLRALAGCRGC